MISTKQNARLSFFPKGKVAASVVAPNHTAKQRILDQQEAMCDCQAIWLASQ